MKTCVRILKSSNFKEVSHESFAFTASTPGIRRKHRTKASFSHLQLVEFDGSIARKLRLHSFSCWNWKEALHENVIFISSTVGIRRKHRTKASFSHIMDAIQMLGFARNIVFFLVNGASGAVNSRLACATGAGVAGSSSDCARSRTDVST